MTAGGLDYTLNKVLTHLSLNTHNRAVGRAQFNAEHLGWWGVFPAFCFPAWCRRKRRHGHEWVAGIQLQELTLGFWRFMLKSIPGLAVVELPCWDAKFRQPCFVGDIVLLAVGYNLRNFFACHHKKNVFNLSRQFPTITYVKIIG